MNSPTRVSAGGLYMISLMTMSVVRTGAFGASLVCPGPPNHSPPGGSDWKLSKPILFRKLLARELKQVLRLASPVVVGAKEPRVPVVAPDVSPPRHPGGRQAEAEDTEGDGDQKAPRPTDRIRLSGGVAALPGRGSSCRGERRRL